MIRNFVLALLVSISAYAQPAPNFTDQTYRDAEQSDYAGGAFDEIKNAFVKSVGKYNKERSRFHDEIISQELLAATPVERPVLIMTAGGPAAGKSTLIDLLRVKFSETPSILVDPDLLKERLPEYSEYKKIDPAMAGEYVHKESSYLSKVLRAAALKQQSNVIVASTLSSQAELDFLESFKLKNPHYRVVILVVEIDSEEAWRRTVARAKVTGRAIPRSQFDRVLGEFSGTLAKVKSQPQTYANEVYFFNNNVRLQLDSLFSEDNGRVFDDLFLQKALNPAKQDQPKVENLPAAKAG